MTKKLVLAGIILLVVSAVAIAADAVSGKWVYEQQGRGGGNPTPVTIELKADGAKLTGTILQPMGMGRGGPGGPGGGAPGGGAPGAAPGGGAPPAPQPVQISNGKVEGTTVTFDVTRETQMGSMTTKYKGVVNGAEMKLSVTRQGMDGTPTTTDVTAKKQ